MKIVRGMSELHRLFDEATTSLILGKDKRITDDKGNVIGIYKAKDKE